MQANDTSQIDILIITCSGAYSNVTWLKYRFYAGATDQSSSVLAFWFRVRGIIRVSNPSFQPAFQILILTSGFQSPVSFQRLKTWRPMSVSCGDRKADLSLWDCFESLLRCVRVRIMYIGRGLSTFCVGNELWAELVRGMKRWFIYVDLVETQHIRVSQ